MDGLRHKAEKPIRASRPSKKARLAVRIGTGAHAVGLSTAPVDVGEPLVTLVRLLRWTRWEVQRRPLLCHLWNRSGKADGRKTSMILEKAEDLARLLLEQTGNLDRLEEEFAVVERALGLEAGPNMPWRERLDRLRRNCDEAHPYTQKDEGHLGPVDIPWIWGIPPEVEN